MSRLRKLISEVHQRSLWQALLIYLGAGWAVFEIVRRVTEGLDLQLLLPALPALILLIDLSVLLAIAFVLESEQAATVSDLTLIP